MKGCINKDYYYKVEDYLYFSKESIDQQKNYNQLNEYYNSWVADRSKIEYFKKIEEFYLSLGKKGYLRLANLYLNQWLYNKAENEYFEKTLEFYQKTDEREFNDKDSTIGAVYYEKWIYDKNKLDYFYKAKEYLSKSIENGNYNSRIRLADMYLERCVEDRSSDFGEKAEEEYLEASKSEFSKSFNGLGYLYAKKWSANKSNGIYFEKAEEYLLKASLNHNDKADNHLGNMYRERWLLNTKKSEYFNKAEQAYLRVIENDNEFGEENLGFIYYEKFVRDENDDTYYKKSEELLLKALEKQGDTVCTKLGLLYHEKWERDKSNLEYFEMAERYYKRGIVFGNKKANNDLGLMYYHRWQLDETKSEYFEIAKENYLIGIEFKDQNAILNFANMHFQLWEKNKSDESLFEVAEEYYIKCFDNRGNLGRLYTTRWKDDKSKIEYAEKALEALNNTKKLGYSSLNKLIEEIAKELENYKVHKRELESNGIDVNTSSCVYRPDEKKQKGMKKLIKFLCGFFVVLTGLCFLSPPTSAEEWTTLLMITFGYVVIVIALLRMYQNLSLYFEINDGILKAFVKGKVVNQFDIDKSSIKMNFNANNVKTLRLQEHKRKAKEYNLRCFSDVEFKRLAYDLGVRFK